MTEQTKTVWPELERKSLITALLIGLCVQCGRRNGSGLLVVWEKGMGGWGGVAVTPGSHLSHDYEPVYFPFQNGTYLSLLGTSVVSTPIRSTPLHLHSTPTPGHKEGHIERKVYKPYMLVKDLWRKTIAFSVIDHLSYNRLNLLYKTFWKAMRCANSQSCT